MGGCITDQNRTELKRVLDENPSIKRKILKAANRLLGQLGSQQIVKLLVNGGLWGERQIMLIAVMKRASES